ncbi:MAG: hypothetical protein K8U57_35390 [Planctomycetes bacterium]|nr:hypothetical protein [Planctomycetota bacterium]
MTTLTTLTTLTTTPFAVSEGTRLLGEVITWTCSGASVRYPDLIAALRDAGLDESVARELAPKHAFTRACKRLSDRRIIRQVAEDARFVRFQFTAESRDGDHYAYELETMLVLDKETGEVSCELPGLATLAQEELDRATEARSGADVTRVIQKLFEKNADLFPIRPQGGAYFCPAAHTVYVEKVQTMLGRLNGQLLRFPVPAGLPEADRSVKEAVAAGLTQLIEEHRKAVAQFGEDTREDTLKRAAEKIRVTRLKVEGYAELLAEEKAKLDRAVADAQDELRAKVAELTAPPVVA